MAFNIDKENSGLVFFNDSDNDAAPQLSGQLNINGEQYRIAMWENEGDKGTFYGVSIQPVDDTGGGGASPRRAGGGNRGGSKPAARSNSGGGAARRGKPTRR